MRPRLWCSGTASAGFPSRNQIFFEKLEIDVTGVIAMICGNARFILGAKKRHVT